MAGEAPQLSPTSNVHPLESSTPLQSPSSTSVIAHAAEIDRPFQRLSPQDSADFVLHPAEMAKGRTAAERYLSGFKNEENRRVAEEALETLATVVSGGRYDGLDFPWQQIQPYHTAAALTILKEKGAPARIEALRCRRDSTRAYRMMPESFPARQVQRIRNTLSKVIEECCELGFAGEDEPGATENGASRSKRTRRRASSTRTRRLLGAGELRALMGACGADSGSEGIRDAVLFALVYRGLKLAEITNLTLGSVRFSNRTGCCHIVARKPRDGGRGRRVELTNDELICLEDWLDLRGDAKGPLLCTLSRGGRVEGKRLTTAMLRKICELRAQQAEVAPFEPNDLSRSAEALVQHRKTVRKRRARLAREKPSEAEQVLFDGGPRPNASEAIRFPFLGLSI